MAHHTTSKHITYTSAKDLGWGVMAIVQSFIKRDKAEIAARLRADGYRQAQIARIIYGQANSTTIGQVSRLLKEVK